MFVNRVLLFTQLYHLGNRRSECAISSFSECVLCAKAIFIRESHNGQVGSYSSHDSVDQSSDPASFVLVA